MTINNALLKTFGNNYKNFKGDIGLEIETETKIDYAVPKFSFWSVHADGSLRDVGKEYVLRQPLDFKDAFPKALEEFKEKTKGIPFIQDSITTSVHVHLNFLNDNFITLGNFLTLYSFVENLLIRYSGDDRLSNLFCLPICDAEETYYNILRMMESVSQKRYAGLAFEEEHTKYGALNISSLVRLGSLEIRSFRGTTDIDVIHTWVGILNSILMYSRQAGLTPPMIINSYKERGIEILSDIFGEYRKVLRHKAEEDLIEQNFWYAANIAFSVKDWARLEEISNTRPKLKDIEALSIKLFNTSFEALTHEDQKYVLAAAEKGVSEKKKKAPNPYTAQVTRDQPIIDRLAALGTRTVQFTANAPTPITLNWHDDPPEPEDDIIEDREPRHTLDEENEEF